MGSSVKLDELSETERKLLDGAAEAAGCYQADREVMQAVLNPRWGEPGDWNFGYDWREWIPDEFRGEWDTTPLSARLVLFTISQNACEFADERLQL